MGYTNPLGKLLGTIAEMIGATIHPGLVSELMDVEGMFDIEKISQDLMKEKTASAKAKSDERDYASPTSGIEADSPIPGQALLFGNDRGTGKRVKRKPKYRIRTYRRVAKKRAAEQIEGQGTLFEVNPASQSAA